MFGRGQMAGVQWQVLQLLIALAMRLLIPVGWMPVFSSEGMTLTWCSGVAELPTPAAAQSHHSGHSVGTTAHGSSHGSDDPSKKPADQSGKSTGVCVFATAAMAFVHVPTALPLPAVTYQSIDWLFPVIVTIGRGLAAPPPPQTGPPIIS